MNDADLRAIATRFRGALEIVGPASGLPGLRNFPKDSCADTVLLLGAHLLDRGLGTFDGVGGEFGTPGDPDWHSHAWLERDGVIVDITADQFPGVLQAVIVTRDDRWHRQFHTGNRGVADFRRYGADTGAQLGVVYDRILELL
jgi:hypothetical protein